MPPKKDLTNQVFGKLTVQSPENVLMDNNKWTCKCDCESKQLKIVKGTDLLKGRVKSCGCLIGKPTEGFKDVKGYFWKIILDNASTRKIPVKITVEDAYNLLLNQNFKCNLSGISIKIEKTSSRKALSTASLDRTESNLFYSKGNLQWIYKDLNNMKGVLANSRFIELCGLVTNPIEIGNIPCLPREIKKKEIKTFDLPLEELSMENIIVSSKIIDKKFDTFTVLKFCGIGLKSKQKFWLCECSCKNLFYISESNLKIRTRGCRDCRVRKNTESPYWLGCGELSKNLWNKYINGAKARQIEFNITIEYAWKLFEEQNRQCAITGLPLFFNKTYKDQPSRNLSLDRIDSSKGYIEGNVQWVLKEINRMKQDYSQAYFKDLCRRVYYHNSIKLNTNSELTLEEFLKLSDEHKDNINIFLMDSLILFKKFIQNLFNTQKTNSLIITRKNKIKDKKVNIGIYTIIFENNNEKIFDTEIEKFDEFLRRKFGLNFTLNAKNGKTTSIIETL